MYYKSDFRRIVWPQQITYAFASMYNNALATNTSTSGTLVEIDHTNNDLVLRNTSGSDFDIDTVSVGPPKIMRLRYLGATTKTFQITLLGDGSSGSANRRVHFALAKMVLK